MSLEQSQNNSSFFTRYLFHLYIPEFPHFQKKKKKIHKVKTVSSPIPFPQKAHSLSLAFTNNKSRAQVDRVSVSTQRNPSLLRIQGYAQMGFLGDSAFGCLLKRSKLGAGRENKAVLCNGGLAPELLNGALDAIHGDGNVRIRSGLIVGKLDGGGGFPAALGVGLGQA